VSETPAFASSITAPSTVGGAAVTITDLSHLSKLVVKTTPARSDGLDVAFGSSAVTDEAVVCGTRPGEWTIIGDASGTAAIAERLDAHVVDVTHGRVLIEVAGPAATSTLEKVCSLDWTDEMMPDGAVTSASVAKVACDVIRHDGLARAYWLSADRSFGQYLYDALIDAAAEFS